MKKNAIKYVISAVLFIDVCSLAAIGLLLAVVIPEGRANRGAKYFLGIHRHDWGNIHLFLSVLLLILLALHIWYNWTWIAESTKRYFGTRWRNALWAFSCAWILVLLVGWIITRF
jgi:Na+/alanine symporter